MCTASFASSLMSFHGGCGVTRQPGPGSGRGEIRTWSIARDQEGPSRSSTATAVASLRRRSIASLDRVDSIIRVGTIGHLVRSEKFGGGEPDEVSAGGPRRVPCGGGVRLRAGDGGLGGGFECGHRFSGATGTFEEVTAGCEQSGVVIVVESIEGGESGIRSVRHADGDGVADSRRRRRPDREQRRVQGSDLGPVGLLDRRRLGVKGCDRRLELERPRACRARRLDRGARCHDRSARGPRSSGPDLRGGRVIRRRRRGWIGGRRGAGGGASSPSDSGSSGSRVHTSSARRMASATRSTRTKSG